MMIAGRFLRAPYLAQLNLRRWLVGRYYGIRRKFPASAPAGATVCIQAPERVLIIVCGLIGDSVMCTPVLEEARRIWPDADITLLGRKHNCDLFAACAYLDRIQEARALPFTISDRSIFADLREWLADMHFDVAIILLGDDFAATVASLNIPVRVGSSGTLLEACLTHPFDCASPRTWGPDEKLNALRSLGFAVSGKIPHLWISDSARSTARRMLSELGVGAGTRYAVLHPFGSEAGRWWPMDRTDELSLALSNRHGLASILVGGTQVRSSSLYRRSRYCVDTVGALDLSQLLAVIEGAAVTITTDSGPYHIAGALRRPVVGLFRASRPEHANRYPGASAVLGHDRDCSGRCGWDRCRRDPCREMFNITVPDILGMIDRISSLFQTPDCPSPRTVVK